MPLSSLIAIANFKAILDFIKDFQIYPPSWGLATFVISEISFGGILFWENGDCKKKGQQEQESDFNIE
jgi:hypothetical protein